MSKVSRLTDKERERLRDIGVDTLPDQATKRGFSLEQVRKKFSSPYFYLFDLMRDRVDELAEFSDFVSGKLEAYDGFQEVILSKGGLFSPSVSPVAPNPDSNHVWVDTKSMAVDAQGQPDASPSENAETLTFGESDDSLTFGEDGNGSVSFQEDGGKDAAEEVTFGESNDDITFGDK